MSSKKVRNLFMGGLLISFSLFLSQPTHSFGVGSLVSGPHTLSDYSAHWLGAFYDLVESVQLIPFVIGVILLFVKTEE